MPGHQTKVSLETGYINAKKNEKKWLTIPLERRIKFKLVFFDSRIDEKIFNFFKDFYQ